MAHERHTPPLPWLWKRMDRDDDAPWYFILGADGRSPVAKLLKYLNARAGEQEAICALIVAAVNERAALREACEAALDYFTDTRHGSEWEGAEAEQLRAALALGEETEPKGEGR